MQWQLSPSVMAEAGTALGILIVAVYFPWRDISRRARLIGSMLLVIAALWILTHSLEIGIPIASYKAYLMGLQLIWGLLTLTLWLMYIIHYTATVKWQTGRIYALFGIMPLLAILALATNSIYGLLWTAPGLNIHNPYLPLEPAYGPVYWASMVYVGALSVSGVFLILKKVFRQPNFRRWEPWTLILAVVIPLIVAFLEVTGVTLSVDLTVGLTPFFSGIGSIVLVWSLPRFHLQKVIPVARNTVFEQIGDCVVVLNMQNRVVDLNPAAERLASYTSSEALGLPVEQIWSNWPSQLVLSEPAPTVFEELVLTRAGEQRTYNLRLYSITDHKNRPLNKVVLLIDITERKQAEAKMVEMEALKRTNQAKSELLANVSHELRTPLTSIKGNIETLLETDVEWSKEQQLDLLQSANQQADRLTLLIRDLLDMSRIDSGKLTLDKRSYQVNEILDSISGVLSVITEKHQLKIANLPDLPLLQADKVRIGQVITNLTENATKFSPEGSQIEIEAALKAGNVIISVADSGIGMPPEVVENLFNRFYQAKAVVEGKIRGTGLGLSICKGIIEAHGGKIWAESQPGKSSKFSFSIPVIEDFKQGGIKGSPPL